MNPILSIVVPTRNRVVYALPTILSLLEMSPEIEVVVSDTSDGNELSAALAGHPELLRLRLLRAPAALNMVDNFRSALRAASGKYLLFIGDDDFVHPDAVVLARWALERGVEAIRCTFPATYYWPDFVSQYYGTGYAGKLSLKRCDGSVTAFNSERAYRNALRQLGGGALDMPRAYLGMVSKVLVDRIESEYGSLFGGVSPDIYSAALVSKSARSSVVVDYPFVVPGSGGGSGSGQGASGKHKAGLRDNPHIASFPDLEWDPRVPEFYSVETVWGFSLVKAAERLGDDQSADFARLYVKCLLLHPDYRKAIFSSLASASRSSGWPALAIRLPIALMAELKIQARRVLRKVGGGSATTGDMAIADLEDTRKASAALQDALVREKIRLQLPGSSQGEL